MAYRNVNDNWNDEEDNSSQKQSIKFKPKTQLIVNDLEEDSNQIKKIKEMSSNMVELMQVNKEIANDGSGKLGTIS